MTTDKFSFKVKSTSYLKNPWIQVGAAFVAAYCINGFAAVLITRPINTQEVDEDRKTDTRILGLCFYSAFWPFSKAAKHTINSVANFFGGKKCNCNICR